MSASFTPGPWRTACEGDSQHQTLISANEFGVAGTRNGGIYVAKVQGPDNRANARLIAAAPELYDMLTVAVGIINAAGIMWLGGDKADAVLAKARGETPNLSSGSVAHTGEGRGA